MKDLEDAARREFDEIREKLERGIDPGDYTLQIILSSRIQKHAEITTMYKITPESKPTHFGHTPAGVIREFFQNRNKRR